MHAQAGCRRTGVGLGRVSSGSRRGFARRCRRRRPQEGPSSGGRARAGGETLEGRPGRQESRARPAESREKAPADASSALKPSLSPQMTALRDRVRKVLVHYFREPINTNDNTPAEILSFCLRSAATRKSGTAARPAMR